MEGAIEVWRTQKSVAKFLDTSAKNRPFLLKICARHNSLGFSNHACLPFSLIHFSRLYFKYNGKHYKQLHCTAMGSPVSVVVAEIVD